MVRGVGSWEEDDPVVWHYPGRKSVGYLCAVCVREGKSLFRKEPEMFNGERFWAYFRLLEIAGQQSGRQVIVIITQPGGSNSRRDFDWISCRPTAPS